MKRLVLIVLILSVLCPYARADAQQDAARDALLAFKWAFEDTLIQRLKKLPKGARISIMFATGPSVEGVFKGYMSYDESIWIREDGDMLQSAYGVREVQNVKLIIRRPV